MDSKKFNQIWWRQNWKISVKSCVTFGGETKFMENVKLCFDWGLFLPAKNEHLKIVGWCGWDPVTKVIHAFHLKTIAFIELFHVCYKRVLVEKRKMKLLELVRSSAAPNWSWIYFLPPDFLMPPVASGPFPAALVFMSSSFFCCSFCCCLNFTSSSSKS